MKRMRILIVTRQRSLDATLGTTTAFHHLIPAWEALGHEVTVWANDKGRPETAWRAALPSRLQAVADQFDVVEVPEQALTDTRADYPAACLLVERRQLWTTAARATRAPAAFPNLLERLRRRVRRVVRPARGPEAAPLTPEAESCADLILVLNHQDARELIQQGRAPSTVTVQPYAVPSTDAARFAQLQPQRSARRVVFVGTFDFRKGAVDLVTLFRHLDARVPEVRLRLVGARGMWRSAWRVRSVFPLRLQRRLEVVMRFDRVDLPHLLEAGSVGVFPSYWEGFGMGALEMMAAGLPTAAYAVPGPQDFVPAEGLHAPGEVAALADTLTRWLTCEDSWSAARAQARSAAQGFSWSQIARATVDVYAAQLAVKRSASIAS